MSFNKQDIYKALEGITAPGEGANLIESKAVTNVVIFGKEILVDVTITNPSLQAKKKVEVEIMKVIHDQVDEKTDVKVNVKVDAPAKPAPAPEVKVAPAKPAEVKAAPEAKAPAQSVESAPAKAPVQSVESAPKREKKRAYNDPREVMKREKEQAKSESTE